MKRFTVMCLIIVVALAVMTPAQAQKQSPGREEYFIATRFDNIYQTEKGVYAVLYEDGSYEPVERFDIDLADPRSVMRVIEEAKMPKEEADYLRGLSLEVISGVRRVEEAVYFASRSMVTTYTIYNGLRVKNDLLYTYSNEFGYQYVVQGAMAKAIASAAVEIAITIGSLVSPTVAFGASLLTLFEQVAGCNVTVVSSDDFVQVDMNYHDIKQWSYGQMDGVNWYLGYCSERVTINRIMWRQHFMVNGYGTTEQSNLYPFETRESSNFTTPALVVYYHMTNPVDEWVTATLYGINWVF